MIDAGQAVERRSDYYVYIYLNPLKGMQPFYVGRGRGGRSLGHLKPSESTNRHKCATIAKIRRETGQDPHVQIHQDGLSYEESCRVERQIIAQYGRVDLGTGILTNMTDGGDGAVNLSKETRRRMSLAKVGTIAVILPDGRKTRVASDDPRWLAGEIAGLTKGIPCSEDRRRRSSDALRGKKQSARAIETRANALRGHKQSPEHVAALAMTRRGKIMVRPRDGGRSFKVAPDDPRLLAGEVVGVTHGRVWVHNPATAACKVVAADDIPEGFIRGRIL